MMIKGGKAEKLSYDHSTKDEAECDRAEEDGGMIMAAGNGPFRLNGVLTVTRAFGDYGLKDCGVIVDPYVR